MTQLVTWAETVVNNDHDLVLHTDAGRLLSQIRVLLVHLDNGQRNNIIHIVNLVI